MKSESQLLQAARERVLVFDGAIGTSVHDLELPLEDYDGHENCTDYLVFSCPDAIRQIHRSFLAVGDGTLGSSDKVRQSWITVLVQDKSFR